MSRQYELKARLKAGQPVFGTFVKSECANIAEMLGWSGFDFAILDCEHSTYGFKAAEDMIRACQLSDVAAIVRTDGPRPGLVHHALESGAIGVQVPSIVTVDDAAQCAAEAVFFPGGTRSPNAATRSGRFTCWNEEKPYMAAMAESSLCVVQVECMEMARRVEELCAIPQIDVLFIGPGDLSMSMGKPGKLTDPEVEAVIEDIIHRGLAGGKIMGMLCGNPAAVKKYIDLGVRYIAYSSDSSMIANAFKKVNAEVFTPYRTETP